MYCDFKWQAKSDLQGLLQRPCVWLGLKRETKAKKMVEECSHLGTVRI